RPVGAARIGRVGGGGFLGDAQGGGVLPLNVIAPRQLLAPAGKGGGGKAAARLFRIQRAFGLGQPHGGEQGLQPLLQPVGGEGLQRGQPLGRPRAGDRLGGGGHPACGQVRQLCIRR